MSYETFKNDVYFLLEHEITEIHAPKIKVGFRPCIKWNLL